MGNLKVGDIVARKSYGGDIFFKVVDIKNNGNETIVTLKGITYRIQADAPESDLIVQSDQNVRDYNRQAYRGVDKKNNELIESKTRGKSKKIFFRDTAKDEARKLIKPGKVLHIDGDSDYLNTCLEEYRKLGIEVIGKYLPEKDQPATVVKLLQEHKPDILVLTGHDGVIKGESSYHNIDNYRNSGYFIEAVKEARKYNGNLDDLIIFAGACQSMYSHIINSGANFASAPERVLIHALDPVFICQKIAFTSITKIVEPDDAISSTITGVKGIGGLQTRGKYRDGYPSDSYIQ